MLAGPHLQETSADDPHEELAPQPSSYRDAQAVPDQVLATPPRNCRRHSDIKRCGLKHAELRAGRNFRSSWLPTSFNSHLLIRIPRLAMAQVLDRFRAHGENAVRCDARDAAGTAAATNQYATAAWAESPSSARGRRTMRWLSILFKPLDLLGVPTRRERAAKKYFPEIDPGQPTDSRIAEVSTAIRRNGRWCESVEWRISTVMESCIDPVDHDGATWYRVSVKCGYELSCECPTLPRAVEFQYIYAALVCDMFWNLGWPSWSSRWKA